MVLDAVVSQTNGIRADLEAVSGRSQGMTSVQHIGQWYYSHGAATLSGIPNATAPELPVTYEGESVFFNPQFMIPGIPYPFRFLDHNMVVIKSGDGTLNFYYFEEPVVELAE